MKTIPKAGAAALILLSAASLSACHARTGDTAETASQSQLPPSPAGLAQAPLRIQTADKTHNLVVEVAASPLEQAKGLMFRTELAPDKGMIFPFAKDRVASFWMKNTVISLDIIFVRRDGTIESVAANTVPYSLESVRSNEPVAAVLEIAAGRAAELGIGPGDMVSW